MYSPEDRMKLPHQVGKVVLQKHLHSTGICEVYMGKNLSSEETDLIIRQVNTKIPTEGAFRTILDERLTSIQKVTSPKFTRVQSAFDAENAIWLSESAPPGASLQRVTTASLAAKQEIPSVLFLHIAISVCEALDALHQIQTNQSKPLLHHAICPANIFMTGTGEITIANFGVSANPIAVAKTFSGHHNLQSIHHLSPELTLGVSNLTAASDIFSVATTLYEILMGAPLFLAQTTIETLHNVRRVDIAADLQKVQTRFPGLEKVFARALAPNASHRYGRAFAMREDLRALLVSYEVESIPMLAKSYLKVIGIKDVTERTTHSTRETPTEELHVQPPPPINVYVPDDETEETKTDVRTVDVTGPFVRDTTAPLATLETTVPLATLETTAPMTHLDATDSMVRPHKVPPVHKNEEMSFDETIPTFSTGPSKTTIVASSVVILIGIMIAARSWYTDGPELPPAVIAINEPETPDKETVETTRALTEIEEEVTPNIDEKKSTVRRTRPAIPPAPRIARTQPTTTSPARAANSISQQSVYEEPVYEEPVTVSEATSSFQTETLNLAEISMLRDKAQRGALTDGERISLVQVPLGIPEYTVARSYL